MDYEKKYNEAVKTASYWHENMEGDVCSVLEEIFPELKESKDEKIRRIVYDWINTQPFDNGISKRDMLAWLEKKCEQKPTNKAKPKFHKGDWIAHDVANFTYQIVGVGSYGYTVFDKEGHTWAVSFSNEGNYHLWSIKDAKDGDVLAFKNNIPGIIICKTPTNYDTKSYCRCLNYNDNCYGSCFIKYEESGWDSTLLFPSTKRQHDILFQKMKEAGYEWDAEKKELRKIKPKPVWSEEDEYKAERLLGWLDTLANYIHHDAKVSLDLRRQRMQQVEQLKTWLKSLKERIKVE